MPRRQARLGERTWVKTENGRAIAFASNAGFRVTSERQTTRIGNQEFVDQEIAMALSLVNDPGCGGHIDTISAHIQAKPTLTTHRDRETGDALKVHQVSPVPKL